jgi:AcrR family transcriptional regulator
LIDHRFGDFAPAEHPERARVRRAAMQLVVERGFEGATVDALVENAKVDRATFEQDFDDLQDCCIKVYLANIDEFDRIVFSAVEQADGWRNRLRASAYAAIGYIQNRPVEARFNLVQMLTVGEMAQVFRDNYVERIIDLIDAGREELDDPDSLSRDVAAGVFGSIYEFLVKQFHDDADIGKLDQYIPDLMYLAVRPYVGHEAALEELNMDRSTQNVG